MWTEPLCAWASSQGLLRLPFVSREFSSWFGWRSHSTDADSDRYWDPFRARAGTAAEGNLVPGLSLIFAVKKVSITRPNGMKETIDNPLYSYKYPERSLFDGVPPAIRPDSAFDRPGDPFRIPLADQWAGHDRRLAQTTRMSKTATDTQSDNIRVQRNLEGLQGQLTRDGGTDIRVPRWRDLMEKAYHTLMIDLPFPAQTDQSPGAYHRFATTEWFVAERSASKGIPVPPRGTRTTRDPMSMENWHDWIHERVGGNFGTMGNPATAGHDPIFIFHHANIDRHFALYQALHPDIWFGAEGMTATGDTVSTSGSRNQLSTDGTSSIRCEQIQSRTRKLPLCPSLHHIRPNIRLLLTHIGRATA